MAENAGVFYMDLPGMPVSGTFQQENVIILHKHRDVFIKIQTAFPKPLRVTCSGEPFYVPSLKKLVMQHNFAEGEEVGLWLKKSFSQDILIEQKTKDGWQRFLSWPVGAIDPNAYAELEECPAPISIVLKPTPELACAAEGNSVPPAIEKFAENKHDDTPLRKLPARTRPLDPMPGLRNDTPSAAEGEPVPAEETAAAQKLRELFQLEKESRPPWEGRHTWLRNVFKDEELALREAEPCIVIVDAEPGSPVERAVQRLRQGVAYTIEKDNNFEVTGVLAAVFQQGIEKGSFLKDLWGTRFYIQTALVRGEPRSYIVFSGNHRLRTIVTGTRYGLLGGNKVTPITVGLGELRNVGSSVEQSVLGMGSKTGKAFLGLALAADFLQWFAEDGNDGDKLVASWLTTGIGATVTAILAPVVITLAVSIAGAIGAATATTAVLIIGGIAIVIAVGWAVDYTLELLGVRDFLYKYIHDANEYYRKRAEEDPEFVMWYM